MNYQEILMHLRLSPEEGAARSGGGENSVASPDLRTQPLQEEIAACAKELWRSYGCPKGRDEQIWLEAERQVLGLDGEISRVGGAISADALNQASPPSTSATAAARAGTQPAQPPPPGAVSPSPASSGPT